MPIFTTTAPLLSKTLNKLGKRPLLILTVVHTYFTNEAWERLPVVKFGTRTETTYELLNHTITNTDANIYIIIHQTSFQAILSLPHLHCKQMRAHQ